MPRYYFHLYDDGVTEDCDGILVTDLQAAEAQAVRKARVMVAEAALTGQIRLRPRILVTDAYGKQVLSVPFNEAVKIES